MRQPFAAYKIFWMSKFLGRILGLAKDFDVVK